MYTTVLLKVVFGCSLTEVKRSVLQTTWRREQQPQTCVSLILPKKKKKSHKRFEKAGTGQFGKGKGAQELAEHWGPSASEMWSGSFLLSVLFFQKKVDFS